MTKQLLFDTLEDMTQGDDIFWEHISTAKHPTKTNGEVYGKLQDLKIAVSTSYDYEMCNAFEKFYDVVKGALGKPERLAVTKEGMKLFNEIYRMTGPSNP